MLSAVTTRSGSDRLSLYAKSGYPVLQSSKADSQQLRGSFAISLHVIEGQQDVSLLELGEWMTWLGHHGRIEEP